MKNNVTSKAQVLLKFQVHTSVEKNLVFQVCAGSTQGREGRFLTVAGGRDRGLGGVSARAAPRHVAAQSRNCSAPQEGAWAVRRAKGMFHDLIAN